MSSYPPTAASPQPQRRRLPPEPAPLTEQERQNREKTSSSQRRRLPPEVTPVSAQRSDNSVSPESSAASTLYSASPHLKVDVRNRRSRHYSDPTWVLLAVLSLGFLFWCWPSISKSPIKRGLPSNVLSPHVEYTPKMPWQTTFSLASRGKGCHLIQDEVIKNVSPGIQGVKAGVLHLFIQHTSAGLTLNENFDPDVRKDMDMALDKAVPLSLPWRHTDEGPEDSASHTKATLVGSSVSIPITNGRLNVGTWQSVTLCEFRAEKHTRRIVATVTP